MGAGSGGGAPHPEPRLPVGCGITPRRGKPHKSIWVSHKSIWGHPINPNYTGSSHLAGQANPSDLRALIRGFKAKKKLDKRWKKLPHPPGWVGAHGNHLQMSAHPSRMWERPLLLQNNPKKKKKSIFWEPFRLPTGCRRLLLWRRQRSQGLFLLPGSLTGLLPGRFAQPSFSFAARGPWEEGMPVSIAMRLALIRALPWEN